MTKRNIYNRSILSLLHFNTVLYVLPVALALTVFMYSEADAVEASTQYGSLRVDPHVYFLDRHDTITVSITGEIYDKGRNRVIVTVVHPDSHSSTLETVSSSDGLFESPMLLNYESLGGTYYVSASAGGKRLGQVSFEVLKTRSDDRIIPQPQPPILQQQNDVKMTVGIDNKTYYIGDKINVYGDAPFGEPIGLWIFNPSESLIFVTQPAIGQDGKYTVAVSTSGHMWSEVGTYTVRIGYEKQTVEANFLLQTPSSNNTPAPGQEQNSHDQVLDTPAQGQDTHDQVEDTPGPEQDSHDQVEGSDQEPDTPNSRPVGPTLPYYLDWIWIPLVVGLIITAEIMRRKNISLIDLLKDLLASCAQSIKRKMKDSLKKLFSSHKQDKSVVLYYECPKCHGPSIENRPNGTALCHDCGYKT